MDEREQLDERYLEAQLHEELGAQPDLSESVLRRVYAQPPRRIIPRPPRKPVWQPLVAAASVLIVAGLATFVLVNVLSRQTGHEQPERRQPAQSAGDNKQPAPDVSPEPEEPVKKVEPKEKQEPQAKDEPRDGHVESPVPEPQPDQEDKTVIDPTPNPPKDQVEDPSDNNKVHGGNDEADPPEPLPDRAKEDAGTAAKVRPVLVSSWKGTAIKVNGFSVSMGDEFEIRAGDTVKARDHADFSLVDGTLLRLDGSITFEGDEKAISVRLDDGALYADTAASLSISGDRVSAVVEGLAVVEERLGNLDLYCLRGRIRAGDEELAAGCRSRLGKDGLGRERVVTWPDVQREFRFLENPPVRVLLREDLDDAPGTLFGGELKDGILRGEADSHTGIGFYLREPYAIGDADVIRFRFRVETPCEMILQFGTVENANWRHKLGGVKPGEWIEYELPLTELYKTTDVARKAEPGLKLKFFQLHPEDAAVGVKIDWVEIVRRPS